MERKTYSYTLPGSGVEVLITLFYAVSGDLADVRIRPARSAAEKAAFKALEPLPSGLIDTAG